MRNESNELRLLFEVSQTLDGVDTVSEHLDAVLLLIAQNTGMMRGTLTLIEPESSEIVVEASFGLSEDERSRARYKLGEGVTGKVIQTGVAMAVPHVSCEPQFLNKTGSRNLQKEDISFLCVPILLDGRTVGALSADRLFDDSVCLDEDLRLLHVLASLISRAVRVRHDIHAMHAAVIEENRRLRSTLSERFDAGSLVGHSATMQALMREVAQVSNSNATVLVTGESGTGKELVAGVIHANSPRKESPLVKINCAALPEGLVESELFGHERGAFTGASKVKMGRFEVANGGTLFLDEVGELSLFAQAKLLRVLQEKEFERVGGTKTRRIDVRLVAATNRNLEEMVAAGIFRQDLYYRLSVFPLHIPPLRERKEDIMILVTHFIDKYSRESDRRIERISSDAASMLREYQWPGNVRELENVIERAVILCDVDGVIDARHLPAWLQRDAVRGTERQPRTLRESLASLEKQLIVEALEAERGNMTKAAKRLDITERMIGLRMKAYELDYRLFRDGEQ